MLRRHDGEKLGHTCFEQSSVALSALGCVAASSALTAVVRRKETAIADRTCFILRLVELSKPTSTLPLRSENCQRKKNCRGDARQDHAERSTEAQGGTLVAHRGLRGLPMVLNIEDYHLFPKRIVVFAVVEPIPMAAFLRAARTDPDQQRSVLNAQRRGQLSGRWQCRR